MNANTGRPRIPGRDFEDRPDTLDALLELLASVAP
jgi:hypothetical protein